MLYVTSNMVSWSYGWSILVIRRAGHHWCYWVIFGLFFIVFLFGCFISTISLVPAHRSYPFKVSLLLPLFSLFFSLQAVYLNMQDNLSCCGKDSGFYFSPLLSIIEVTWASFGTCSLVHYTHLPGYTSCTSCESSSLILLLKISYIFQLSQKPGGLCAAINFVFQVCRTNTRTHLTSLYPHTKGGWHISLARR